MPMPAVLPFGARLDAQRLRRSLIVPMVRLHGAQSLLPARQLFRSQRPLLRQGRDPISSSGPA